MVGASVPGASVPFTVEEDSVFGASVLIVVGDSALASNVWPELPPQPVRASSRERSKRQRMDFFTGHLPFCCETRVSSKAILAVMFYVNLRVAKERPPAIRTHFDAWFLQRSSVRG